MRDREILTYPLSKEQFCDEFDYFILFFQNRGFEQCKILFGAFWGNDYYPTSKWDYEQISLSKLRSKVEEVEKKGFGEFGYNDLFVEVEEFEFRFCNDTDIHIGFDSSSELVESFYTRWGQLGYKPAEWLKNQKNGPGERTRYYEENT